MFLARHYFEEDLRVVKVLHQLGYDPEKRFEREIRILQDRSNSNSVKILDFGVTHAGHKYYAMEYCPLGDIRKPVGLVNPSFAIRVVDDVCTALTPFHERDGFHRDIKPDNILMVEHEGSLRFKLSDFGLAQDNNTSSVFTNNAAGTLGYLAPEIIAGKPYTPAADIYSLGITIRELLNGDLHTTITSQEKFGNVAMILRRMLMTEPERRLSLERIHAVIRRTRDTSLQTESAYPLPIAIPKRQQISDI